MPPGLTLCVATIAVCWLLSIVTDEYSWVDRLWSVLPPVYGWIYAVEAGMNPRAVLIALLMSAWGLRLSFNFWRKGGYARGGEDYRWKILRGRMPRWAWMAFNLAFTHIYQLLLIWAFTLPGWRAGQSDAPIGPLDAAVAACFLAFLVGETVADQQQWNFHQAKKAGTPLPSPFLDTGLFRWSRHPNFFCEQGQWWTITLFAPAAGLAWLDWTLIGPVLLTLLFDGSVRFTESITASKYPTYRDYQRRTSRQIPWFRS